MNKKAQGMKLAAWLLIAFMGIIAVGLVLVLTGVLQFPGQTVTDVETTAEIAEITKEGDVSSLGIYVRDLSNNDINTKVAVAVYCKDDLGNFVVDGTSSSTSAEITGKTEIGREVECWAFNTSFQSIPMSAPMKIEGESPHLVIDGYNVALIGKLVFYADDLTSTNGATNITAAADATDTLNKLRLTNNLTDNWLPVAGIYMDQVVDSNVSAIAITESLTYSGGADTATIKSSTLGTAVSTRKEKWDFVYEIDDDPNEAGNQPLLLKEHEYFETGTISVTADGDGCTAAASNTDRIDGYGFTAGYYKSKTGNEVKFGTETDATTPAVISTDIIGNSWNCIT